MTKEEEPKAAQEDGSNPNSLQPPAVRPPRKLSRPNITLKMPTSSTQIPPFYNTPGLVNIPLTPATGLPPNYPYNVFNLYPNKAQEFMFKQFEGFKDFTKNTGKLGLSFGEKFTFWFYGKAKGLSTNNFTHVFLLIVVCLYCIIGGILFFIFENDERGKLVKKWQSDNENVFKSVTANIYIKGGNHTAAYNNTIVSELGRLVNHYIEQYSLDRRYEEWGIISSMYYCGTIFTTIDLILGLV